MTKKKIQVTIISLLFCVGWVFGGTIQAPEKTARWHDSSGGDNSQIVDQALASVPLPTLSATEALDIAKQQIVKEATRPDDYTIVAIEWCKSSDFRPIYGDGTQWQVLYDKDAYAWFVTYLAPDPTGIPAPRRVGVIRVMDNGKIGDMIWTRT